MNQTKQSISPVDMAVIALAGAALASVVAAVVDWLGGKQ